MHSFVPLQARLVGLPTTSTTPTTPTTAPNIVLASSLQLMGKEKHFLLDKIYN